MKIRTAKGDGAALFKAHHCARRDVQDGSSRE
jgi:hypothetical protein